MTLDRNNSAIKKQLKVFDFNENIPFSNRILIKIDSFQLDSSVVAGDVIRYDTTARQYVRSLADNSANAEVFGIVESFDSGGNANVVINGSITILAENLNNISGTNSGGNDIYFLSGITPGKLQNCGPTYNFHIIKPIYQIAPHEEYTGIFKNYLGYINQNITSSTNQLLTFNRSLNRALIFNQETQSFSIFQSTFNPTTSKFTFSQLFKSNGGFNLQSINYVNNLIFDCRISIDGRHILIFNKLINKIYYIYVDENDSDIFKLKNILDVNIPGTVEDKLWDADDEITSFAVSSKALNRLPSENDVMHVSPSISSKIKYYKRNLSATNPFKWKKIHENHAFGCSRSDNFSQYLQFFTTNDLPYTYGIFRMSDIRCCGKNYTMSSMAFKNDYASYKASQLTFKSLRYTQLSIPQKIISNITISGLTGSVLTNFSPATVGTNIPSYIPSDVLYFLNGYNKSFIINFKDTSGNYYEDHSYRALYGFIPNKEVYGSGVGVTAFNNNSDANKLDIEALGSLTGSPFTVGLTPSENICSSSYTTGTNAASAQDICIVAKLYNLYQTNEKQLVIYKYPFYANIPNSVMNFFEHAPTASPAGLRPIPGDSGYLKVFKVSDIPEINSMTYIKIFGDTSKSFIFTSSYVIVLTHSTSSFIKINLNLDFTKAQHRFTAINNFFILDSKIYRYNSTTSSFDIQQTINL